jgi:hypothetical protein
MKEDPVIYGNGGKGIRDDTGTIPRNHLSSRTRLGVFSLKLK